MQAAQANTVRKAEGIRGLNLPSDRVLERGRDRGNIDAIFAGGVFVIVVVVVVVVVVLLLFSR